MQQTQSKWSFYVQNCFEYNLAPVEKIKKCLQDEEFDLDLSYYIPRTLGTQLIFEALLGPPLAQLNSINCSCSPFSKNACEYLAEFMENSTTLEHFNLAYCGIGFLGIQILIPGIDNCKSLTCLNLSACNLTDEGGSIVANALSNNGLCETLDLSRNDLHSLSGKALGAMLISNIALKTLRIGRNNLYPESECIVPLLKGLAKNTGVRTIDLCWNGLMGGLFAKSCRTVIKKNAVLEEINLEFNRLTADELRFVAMGVKKAKSLKTLKLDGNPLSANDIRAFLVSIEAKNSLSLLSFGTNTWLTTECTDIISRILKKYPALQIISRGCFIPAPLKTVDFSKLLMDRCKFLAMAPKKKKDQRDMGDFFIKMLNGGPEFCSNFEFEKLLISDFKAKLDKKLTDQVALNWTETYGKKGGKKRIALHKLANYYLELHPAECSPQPGLLEEISEGNAETEQ